jgi:hypothetical protein
MEARLKARHLSSWRELSFSSGYLQVAIFGLVVNQGFGSMLFKRAPGLRLNNHATPM